jgi:hypothetical protein
LVIVTPSHAAREKYGDIEIALDYQPTGQLNHGYVEFRVQIANTGTERTHRVKLDFPDPDMGGRSMGGLRGLTRTVDVAPGKVTVVSLFQPATPEIFGSSLVVTLDGRKQETKISMNPVSGYGGTVMHSSRRMYTRPPRSSTMTIPLILMSQRIDENFIRVPGLRGMRPATSTTPPAPPPGGGASGKAMTAPVGGAGMAFGPGTPLQAIDGQFQRAPVAISGWTDRWLGYSGYDGIIVTREDLEELERGTTETKAVLQALWQYVETGGTMVVLGPGKVKVPPSWEKNSGKTDGLTTYRCGFGACIVSPDRNSPKWSPDRWQTIQSSFAGSSMPWRSGRALVEINRGFAVVDDLSLPVKGLFALLIIFGITIGPVNLALLARKNKRIWLLWTVPLLSGLFCAMVLGYMIVAEGWQGHSRTAGLTLLDETEKRATTIGKTAFYCPMTPGDGLRFDTETEVLIQGSEHPAYAGSTYIDWSNEQHLSHGWVTARVPAHFTMRKSAPSLLRLNLRKDGEGNLSVINALSVDITKLTLMDDKGDLWEAGEITAGANVKLTKTKREPRAEGSAQESLRRFYTSVDWGAGIDNARLNHKELLGPGMYVAVVSESPFLEHGLRRAKVRASPSIVVGIMADDKVTR